MKKKLTVYSIFILQGDLMSKKKERETENEQKNSRSIIDVPGRPHVAVNIRGDSTGVVRVHRLDFRVGPSPVLHLFSAALFQTRE